MSRAMCSAGCVEQLMCRASFSIELGSSGEREFRCGSGQGSCLGMEVSVKGAGSEILKMFPCILKDSIWEPPEATKYILELMLSLDILKVINLQVKYFLGDRVLCSMWA